MADVTLVMKADASDHLKKIKDVQNAHVSLNKTVVDNQKREKGLIEDIEAELTKLQDKKKRAYSVDDIEKYNKKIAEAKMHLEEYDKAGTKSVKTTASMTQSIGKWVGGMAIAVTVMNALKEAFLKTQQGILLFNVATAAMNQILANVVNGVDSWNKGLGEAVILAKQMNELRIKDGFEMLKSKKLMQEYNELYTDGVDQTKDSIEKIRILTTAKEKYIAAVNIEIRSTKEQLELAMKAWKLQPTGEEARLKVLELTGKLYDLNGQLAQGTRRLVSRITGEVESSSKEQADALKRIREFGDELDKALLLDAKTYAEERIKIETGVALQTIADKTTVNDVIKKLDEDYFKMLDDKAKKEIESNLETVEDATEVREYLLELDKNYFDDKDKLRKEDAKKDRETEEDKKALREKIWQEIFNLEQAIVDISTNINYNKLNEEIALLERNTQAKIKAAGTDQAAILKIQEQADAKRLDLEKKFKREQQKIAIAQTIINGAQAIVKTYAEYGYTPLAIALQLLMATVTALQVGVIKSQKFAKGGWTGSGDRRDETGEKVAGIVHAEEFVTKRGPAAKYREMLEAINRDDQRAIVRTFNNIDIPDMSPNILVSSNVENTGPNSRLDKLIAENRKLNSQIANSQTIQDLGNTRIVKRGNSTRIIKR
jgi:hypothetical protein